MTDELVKRLRVSVGAHRAVATDAILIDDPRAASILDARAAMLSEAADRITALSEENERLKQRLREIAEIADETKREWAVPRAALARIATLAKETTNG